MTLSEQTIINGLEHELALLRQQLAESVNATIERCAKACEKRAEIRWQERGITEWDTNASYYDGADADFLNERDEEDESCATAIRALKVKI